MESGWWREPGAFGPDSPPQESTDADVPTEEVGRAGPSYDPWCATGASGPEKQLRDQRVKDNNSNKTPKDQQEELNLPLPPYELRPFKAPMTPQPWFPWLTMVPAALRDWLQWEEIQTETAHPVLVVLYSSPDDGLSLDSAIKQSIPPDTEVMGIDICRSEDHNMLSSTLPIQPRRHSCRRERYAAPFGILS